MKQRVFLRKQIENKKRDSLLRESAQKNMKVFTSPDGTRMPTNIPNNAHRKTPLGLEVPLE